MAPRASCCTLANSSCGKRRPREALGKQRRRAGKIVPQRRGAAEHGEPPGAHRQLPADRIEVLGDLLGGMVGRAHVEHRADQRRAAGRLLVVDQRAAQHERLDVDQRQLGVPLQQHAQPVGQPHQADFALGRLRRLRRRLRRAARRGDDHPVEPLRHEVPPGDVADLLGRDLLDALDVRLVEQRIAGGEEVAAQAVGRLLDRLPAEDQLGGLLLLGLRQLLRADQLVAQPVDLAEDLVARPSATSPAG